MHPHILRPRPPTQLLEALYASGGQPVFASSRCFSTTYRDEKSSVESTIVAAKAFDIDDSASRSLLLECVVFTFGDLHTQPESGIFPVHQWDEEIVSGDDAAFTTSPVTMPRLERFLEPTFVRGAPTGTAVAEIARLVWPARRIIGEISIEHIDRGLSITTVTVHVERMASLLRDLPLRLIRNLGGIRS